MENNKENTYFFVATRVNAQLQNPFSSETIFPGYLYSNIVILHSLDEKVESTPNINPTILQQIAAKLGLGFTQKQEAGGNVCFINSEEVRPEFRTSFAPVDLVDYIYAVLHSLTCREQYKGFLKADFLQMPYPKDTTTFWQLVKFGSELRKLHLLESPVVNRFITQYPVDGDNKMSKIKCEEGKVYINDTQYFDGVPPIAWQFYIGGYQPAQKWLKDCKGRELSLDDILHYQKIIVALTETDRLMKEIDKIEME